MLDMVATTRRRAATAFHEAGHAVVAFHLGVRVREVSIRASGDAEGHVRHYAPPSWFQPDVVTGARIEKRVADRVLIPLAGREAERRSLGRYNNTGARHDMDFAANLAMYVNGSAEATMAYLAWLGIGARDLVSDDVKVWPLIKQVVDDLIATEAISGKSLQARMIAMTQRLQTSRS